MPAHSAFEYLPSLHLALHAHDKQYNSISITHSHTFPTYFKHSTRRCVVHYQLPASADTYVHRAGRTARAGAEGLSVALIAPQEAPRWTALNRTMVSAVMCPSLPTCVCVICGPHQSASVPCSVLLHCRIELICGVPLLHRDERTDSSHQLSQWTSHSCPRCVCVCICVSVCKS